MFGVFGDYELGKSGEKRSTVLRHRTEQTLQSRSPESSTLVREFRRNQAWVGSPLTDVLVCSIHTTVASNSRRFF